MKNKCWDDHAGCKQIPRLSKPKHILMRKRSASVAAVYLGSHNLVSIITENK